jgi:predicted flap endonuclease-1-like 5' DNA nuclease
MDPTVIGLIVGIILVAVTIWLILMGTKKDNERINVAQQQKVAEVVPLTPPAAAVPAAPPVPQKPDDLTIIEGIGPKIAGILNQNGITTFAQLASTDVQKIVTILKQNKLQFTKPDSWMEQARLAANGKMDELKALQAKLVAGR